MKHRLQIVSTLFLFVLCLCYGCSKEEEYYYPSVKLEFLTATTNQKGIIQEVIADNGKVYHVQNDGSNLKLPADTLLRIVTNYEEVEGGVKLYGAAVPISNIPIPVAEFEEEMVHDPASIQSIWMGRDYLNMILQVKAQNKKHTFRFIEQEATLNEAGDELFVHIILYHYANEDIQAYTQRAYASIPLKHYAAYGCKKVLLRFSPYTDYEGVASYDFEYLPNIK